MEDANIHTAMEAEKEFVNNPICITAYEQHQKYLRDKHAREKFLRKEGIAIGRKEGEAIGIAKAVLALRNKGKSDLEIAELLDMDVKAVQAIQ